MTERKRVELPGSRRLPVVGEREVGPVPPSEILEVTIVLRRGSPPGAFPSLAEIDGGSRTRARRWTRDELAQAHGARVEDRSAVRAFLTPYGLRVVEDDPARRTIRAAGTAGAFERAFGTKLIRRDGERGPYRGRVGPLRIPRPLVGAILAVLGLDDRPAAAPRVRPRPTRAAAEPSYTPLQVAQAYQFPAGLDGSGQCIAVVELGGGYRPDDLARYAASLGLPAPSVTGVSVDGASNAPTGAPDGPDGEVELDLEIAGAIAPGARLVAYFAPNTDAGFLDAVSSAVHDSANRPTIVSISWGGPEASWTEQARTAFEAVFEDAAALGVTVLAAAGDDGATDGGPAGSLAVDFPASSPAVVGCGGTRLTIAGGADVAETVWNELANGEGATGGGVSEAFGIPSYQSLARVPLAPNGSAGRGVPDVAADADPVTGYAMLIDGTPTVLGGTSAVAPLWAGLLARINQSLGTPVGFVNPALYRQLGSPDFGAITSGGNGGYSAGPGWNPCTGLGSPRGAALLASLRAD